MEVESRVRVRVTADVRQIFRVRVRVRVQLPLPHRPSLRPPESCDLVQLVLQAVILILIPIPPHGRLILNRTRPLLLGSLTQGLLAVFQLVPSIIPRYRHTDPRLSETLGASLPRAAHSNHLNDAMADVRSLLRQQREARRIDHPHAAYSDAGKLLCTVCREHIKTESLWEGHLQTANHRQRLQKLRDAASAKAEAQAAGQEEESEPKAETAEVNRAQQKRKHGTEEDGDEGADDAIRRKKSRPDIAEDTTEKDTRQRRSNSDLTPPSLNRRTSTTPSQGVELQIPSRPATPAHRDGNTAAAANGASTTNGQTSLSNGSSGSAATTAAAAVDEAEWAAFEAEVEAASIPRNDHQDATISAPAMTAEESAAAKLAEEEAAEQDASKRQSKGDADLAMDKEEASRALEEEFEEMEELEARVQKMKEMRERIRKKRSESEGALAAEKPIGLGKENVQGTIVEEEEDDDDDEDDDDWDGFRFRAR